jgi:hypothetical protein
MDTLKGRIQDVLDSAVKELNIEHYTPGTMVTINVLADEIMQTIIDYINQ